MKLHRGEKKLGSELIVSYSLLGINLQRTCNHVQCASYVLRKTGNIIRIKYLA